MSEELEHHLSQFVNWARAYLSGDEKGEAQIFLDRLFQALGHAGCLDVGGQAEFRVRKSKASGGGTAFADYVWKPYVLIEMKRRGTDLRRHYRQAFEYWTRLVPNRPRYTILCNFDSLWVYDFEVQMDEPVERIQLNELAKSYGAITFLLPTPEPPVFGNDHEAVTREAADLLARCFNSLSDRGVPREKAQRFTLQTLIALFAEDIGLLDRYTVTRALEDCARPADTYDILGQLFVEMNTPGRTAGGRFQGVDFFNGGVFRDPVRLDLRMQELDLLVAAAKYDWAKVRPEIFGTLFEHSLDKDARHAYGAHFTHPTDIMKIVQPTIVEPWSHLIESATTQRRLYELHQEMQRFRVLDPACGSGNFLYIAYREIKRLEARIFERINSLSKKPDSGQLRFGFVTAANFYGIDIDTFAVEIAKVTMMLGRKLAVDELHITEPVLPLDNLDTNFFAGDALLNEQGNSQSWPESDVIIGNPPFLGSKRLKPERGSHYVKQLRKAYPAVPGMADYCVYWFRKAHDHLPVCEPDKPYRGRAGLVGTQNIRNNKSREGGLQYIAQSGTITEAVQNQTWSGEANVHVSIANWAKSQEDSILPKRRKLWVQASDTPVAPPPGLTRPSGSEVKRYNLDLRVCETINASLSDEIDVTEAQSLPCNKKPKSCFQGKIPGYDGFILSQEQAKALTDDSADVVFPYLTGRELLGDFRIERWAIDFGNLPFEEAAKRRSAFEWCKAHVLPGVQEKARQAEAKGSDMADARLEHLGRWWQFWNRRDELNATMKNMKRYIACSRVSRRHIMVFLSTSICPSDLIQVFALQDDYSFGILQSTAHFEWIRQSSRLKVETDLRYSVREVFEKFPWPQNPSEESITAVATAAVTLRKARESALYGRSDGLRNIYRDLELPGRSALKRAHNDLDEAVRIAYGFSENKSLLSQLFQLNLDVARRQHAGEEVQGPGLPVGIGRSSEFISDDAVGAKQVPDCSLNPAAYDEGART